MTMSVRPPRRDLFTSMAVVQGLAIVLETPQHIQLHSAIIDDYTNQISTLQIIVNQRQDGKRKFADVGESGAGEQL